jgi:hypothetical protein
MQDAVEPLELRPTTAEVAFEWFHRIVAAYCLLFGMLYWVRLIGFYEGALWRFDLMPIHWQVAAVSLSVLFPVAAIGLWMLASWGPVIWFCCAAAEIAMYAVFPDLFGRRPLIVAWHIGVALLYGLFRLGLHLQRRKPAEQPD